MIVLFPDHIHIHFSDEKHKQKITELYLFVDCVICIEEAEDERVFLKCFCVVYNVSFRVIPYSEKRYLYRVVNNNIRTLVKSA